jgi:mannose-1-phosphate guanylyltransferase
MKAIILVGGGGTRLRPLTYTTPKALVPVANRPLLEYLLRHLRNHGIVEIVLATSRENTAIERRFGDGAGLGLKIAYAYEEEPLGSGGAIREAARGINETFLVCNGDIITTLDLRAMLAAHRQHGALVSISLIQVEDPSRFGVAEVSPAGEIRRFVEKPAPGTAPSNWINGGVWIFESRALQRFPEGREIIMDGWVERVLFPEIAASDELLFGFRSDAYWIDVGTPETYIRVQHDLLAGKLPSLFPVTDADTDDRAPIVHPTARIEGQVLIGAGCRIGGQVEIIGPAVLGAGCAVRERARIERAVLWERVRVGSSARVSESIVGHGVRIGDEAVVHEALLGEEAGVKRGHRLPPGARLDPGMVVPAPPAENT